MKDRVLRSRSEAEARLALRPSPLPRGLEAIEWVPTDHWLPAVFDGSSAHPWFLTPPMRSVDLSAPSSDLQACGHVCLCWLRLAHEVVFPRSEIQPDLADYRARVPPGRIVGQARAVDIVPRGHEWVISVAGVPGRLQPRGGVSSTTRKTEMPPVEVLEEAWWALVANLSSFDGLPISMGARFERNPRAVLMDRLLSLPGPRPIPAREKNLRGVVAIERPGWMPTEGLVVDEGGGIRSCADGEDASLTIGPWFRVKNSKGYAKFSRYWSLSSNGEDVPILALHASASGPEGPWEVELGEIMVGDRILLQGFSSRWPRAKEEIVLSNLDSVLGSTLTLLLQDRGEAWSPDSQSLSRTASFFSSVEGKLLQSESLASAQRKSARNHGRRSRL